MTIGIQQNIYFEQKLNTLFAELTPRKVVVNNLSSVMQLKCFSTKTINYFIKLVNIKRQFLSHSFQSFFGEFDLRYRSFTNDDGMR
jgi:hypothetical protein